MQKKLELTDHGGHSAHASLPDVSQVLVAKQFVATRLKESLGLVLFNEVRQSLEPFDALQKSTDFANGSPAYLRGAPGTQVYEI